MLLVSRILFAQFRHETDRGSNPFSSAHSSVDLNVRVTLTISKSYEKQYSMRSLRLMFDRHVKFGRPFTALWCSMIFLISLYFADSSTIS